MPHISPDSLLSLETYARERGAYRARVLAHKKGRTVHIGEHLTLIFEDEVTVRYQVQEMLRIERIFEEEGIRGELEAYNPLIPDGGNWKATLLLEYPDPEDRKRKLAGLKGIEDATWIQVEGGPKIKAIADEDLDRENEEKTSAVHFLRFELDAASRAALKGGARLSMGVDHPNYTARVEPSDAVRSSLASDLK
jgi:hypothetical protein